MTKPTWRRRDLDRKRLERACEKLIAEAARDGNIELIRSHRVKKMLASRGANANSTNGVPSAQPARTPVGGPGGRYRGGADISRYSASKTRTSAP